MDATAVDRRKKKSLLINPKFQLRFLAYTFATVAFTIAVFFVAKMMFFAEVESYLFSIGFAQDHVVFQFLKAQSVRMNQILLGASVLELVVVSLIGLRLSHRVAGPLYRLTQDLESFASGSPKRQIHFRKNDFFPEVADAVNKVIEGFLRR